VKVLFETLLIKMEGYCGQCAGGLLWTAACVECVGSNRMRGLSLLYFVCLTNRYD